MIGKLDPDEDVMDDTIIAQRKSTALMKALHDNIKDTIAKLGWDCYDNVVVEIAGSSVYMIDGVVLNGLHIRERLNITKMRSL